VKYERDENVERLVADAGKEAVTSSDDTGDALNTLSDGVSSSSYTASVTTSSSTNTGSH